MLWLKFMHPVNCSDLQERLVLRSMKCRVEGWGLLLPLWCWWASNEEIRVQTIYQNMLSDRSWIKLILTNMWHQVKIFILTAWSETVFTLDKDWSDTGHIRWFYPWNIYQTLNFAINHLVLTSQNWPSQFNYKVEF